MEWIVDNWPLALALAAVAFVIFGIVKRLIKLAVLAGIAAVVFFVIWPMVSDKI